MRPHSLDKGMMTNEIILGSVRSVPSTILRNTERSGCSESTNVYHGYEVYVYNKHMEVMIELGEQCEDQRQDRGPALDRLATGRQQLNSMEIHKN